MTMTQKEKITEAWLSITQIKSWANTINEECAEYSSTAAAYARRIIGICDRYIELDKPKRKSRKPSKLK